MLAAWWALGMPPLSTTGWILAIVSGVVELAYFVTISSAYRRGDLSTVYPIARGTAATGAAIVGIAILGERPGPVALAGSCSWWRAAGSSGGPRWGPGRRRSRGRSSRA